MHKKRISPVKSLENSLNCFLNVVSYGKKKQKTTTEKKEQKKNDILCNQELAHFTPSKSFQSCLKSSTKNTTWQWLYFLWFTINNFKENENLVKGFIIYDMTVFLIYSQKA